MWAQYWDQYCPLSTHRVFKLWDAGLNTAVYMHYWVSWRERPSLVPWGDVQGEASSLPVLLVNAQKNKKKTLRVSAAACLGHPSWTDAVAEEKKQRLFLYCLLFKVIRCLNRRQCLQDIENTAVFYPIVWPYEWMSELQSTIGYMRLKG